MAIAIAIIGIFLFFWEKKKLEDKKYLKRKISNEKMNLKEKPQLSEIDYSHKVINEDKTILNDNVVLLDKIELPVTEYKLPPLSLIKSDNSRAFLEALQSIDNISYLTVIIGKTNDKWSNESISKFPNLLIGGTIMTGKTAYINTMICTLLMRSTPEQLKLVIIDSKGVDYNVYNGIGHLLIPIITSADNAFISLNNVRKEIKKRYKLLQQYDIRTIAEYNKKMILDGRKALPNIVIIIDELMSLVLDNELINDILEDITQLGWKVGFHLIMVVNHPSTDIISTITKSNFPTRIAFQTTSKKDSRIILDETGAEKLTRVGNILYSPMTTSEIIKMEIPYIDESDIINITNYIIKQYVNKYELLEEIMEEESGLNNIELPNEEPLYNEIVEFVVTQGKASASLLQRRFKLGYNRAAHAIDLLEESGIIGPANGSTPREVLVRIE